MLFESTTVLLRSIVDSLEGGDEIEWEGHLECSNQCVFELFQMSRPERRKYGGHVATVFDRAARAIPNVRLMNRAIRRRDRATAIQYGRAAISEMNGVARPIPSIPPAGDSVIAPKRTGRKTTTKRTPAAQGKPARAVEAG